MEKIIAACGNDCAVCPRHLPKTEDELRETSELWYKIGYRDRIVSNEEISCIGCKKENWCRYEIVSCTEEKGIKNCGECKDFECEKIKKCFEVTASFIGKCVENCTKAEFEKLQKAFFEKEKNLKQIQRNLASKSV